MEDTLEIRPVGVDGGVQGEAGHIDAKVRRAVFDHVTWKKGNHVGDYDDVINAEIWNHVVDYNDEVI